MTDKEKLIELIGESLCNHLSLSCKLAENIAADLIANGVTFATDNNVGDKVDPVGDKLSATKGQKWIPVTERLPDAGTGKVLCITQGGHCKVLEWLGTFGFWSDPYGIDFTNFRREYITHWMPLPEPPKGEKA